MIKNFEFKRLVKDIGYVGGIALDISFTDNTAVAIQFDDQIQAEWRSAIEFGVNYFYSQIERGLNKGLNVDVLALRTMVVDTSNMVVFYITVKCLCEALEYPHELVYLNEDGKFVINK